MSDKPTRSEFIGVKTRPHERQLLELAAAETRKYLAEFIRDAALERARSVVSRQQEQAIA